MPIKYVQGDIFQAIAGKSNIIIPHVCNDIGGWGSGFVVSLSKFDKEPEQSYRDWFKGISPTGDALTSNRTFGLGETQIVGVVRFKDVETNIEVANMVAQHRTITTGEKIPLRYSALSKCMQYIAKKMLAESGLVKATEIYCPKFGSGLAGGNWDFIETLINEIWVNEGIPVTVFELYERKK